MTVLVVTAVDPERDAAAARVDGVRPAVLGGIAALAGGGMHFVAAGVGSVAAAIITTRLLTMRDYDLVVNAGIGGGFAGRAAVGGIAVADRVVPADLGALTDTGFLTLADMRLPSPELEPDVDAVARPFAAAMVPHVVGTVLTSTCMTGTDDRAAELAARHGDAVAEGMEGYGVVSAAHAFAVPAAEVRAISNVVGRRDPQSWDFAGAFTALAIAVAALAPASARIGGTL